MHFTFAIASYNNFDMKRKLFVLANSIWRSDDYLNDRNCDPVCTDTYLYATTEECEKKARELDVDDDVYNDGTIYEGELEESEILELTGFETIGEFDEALAEPYSTDLRKKNLGEVEKGSVAAAIIENATNEYSIECANYDFNKSLEGAVLVFWSWERYVGYARKCLEMRRGRSDDTEALLTKQDRVFVAQCDVLLTAQEAEDAGDDLCEAILYRLYDGRWKWTNPWAVKRMAIEL